MIPTITGTRTEDNGTPAKVFLVDEHDLVREGLRQLIDSQPDMYVCGEASNVSEARRLAPSLAPEVVIVELHTPESKGLDFIKWLMARQPKPKVLVYSPHEEGSYGERALRLGAMGFVHKSKSSKTILVAIRSLLENKLFFSEELTRQMLLRAIQQPQTQAKSDVEKLSNRELEILTLLGQGDTSDMIARRLFLSRNTIGTYRERLKHKLGLKNCTELTHFAIRYVEEPNRVKLTETVVR